MENQDVNFSAGGRSRLRWRSAYLKELKRRPSLRCKVRLSVSESIKNERWLQKMNSPELVKYRAIQETKRQSEKKTKTGRKTTLKRVGKKENQLLTFLNSFLVMAKNATLSREEQKSLTARTVENRINEILMNVENTYQDFNEKDDLKEVINRYLSAEGLDVLSDKVVLDTLRTAAVDNEELFKSASKWFETEKKASEERKRNEELQSAKDAAKDAANKVDEMKNQIISLVASGVLAPAAAVPLTGMTLEELQKLAPAAPAPSAPAPSTSKRGGGRSGGRSRSTK